MSPASSSGCDSAAEAPAAGLGTAVTATAGAEASETCSTSGRLVVEGRVVRLHGIAGIDEGIVGRLRCRGACRQSKRACQGGQRCGVSQAGDSIQSMRGPLGVAISIVFERSALLE